MRSIPLILVIAAVISPLRAAVSITREKADALIAELPTEDPWEKSKDASTLAWNESYVIHAFIDMYEATGDARYLRDAVARGDRILSHRDDRRNFADSSGKTHKRWSLDSKYTVGEAVLNDDAGKPSIKLRSTLFAYNHLTSIDITTTGDRFTVHLTNRWWKRDETFADLSTDPTDARYFEKIINDTKPRPRPFCDPGQCTAASQLLIARPIGDRPSAPVNQKLSLKPLWHAHVGYTGIIYHPMLRLALLVKNDPALQPEFAEPARRFTDAAAESYEELHEVWRDGPNEGEGYYVSCARGGADAYDNVGHAFNYLGKLASSELILFQLTNKPIYKQHVERIGRLLKNRLHHDEKNDLYVWNYWYEPITTGWTKQDNISDNTPHHKPWPQVEDTSHGALEVEMAVNAAADGIVFDATDLRRFANTFLRNVVLPDRSGFNAHVDGTDPNSRYKETRVVGWLALAHVDRAIYDVAAEVYQKRGRDDFRSLAALLKWQKRLERPAAAPRAKAGAYYFDGWTGKTDDLHLPERLRTEFAARQPVWGWRDDSIEIVQRQIDLAADHALSFFAFDWYWPEGSEKKSPLNTGLELYLRANNRARLEFCILVANAGGFRIFPADWPTVCDAWVKHFREPTYLKVDGTPLLIIFSHRELRDSLGGSDAVRKAFDDLRERCKSVGLAGVTIAACCLPGPHKGWVDLNLLVEEGYDCFTGYAHYGHFRRGEEMKQSFADLIAGHEDIWSRFAAANIRPYIPVVTTGWDPRPWQRASDAASTRPYWLHYPDRTPDDVRRFVDSAVRFLDAHPKQTTRERILLLYAWNEYGEGGHLAPTRGDKGAYLHAVAEALRSTP